MTPSVLPGPQGATEITELTGIENLTEPISLAPWLTAYRVSPATVAHHPDITPTSPGATSASSSPTTGAKVLPAPTTDTTDTALMPLVLR